MPRPPSAYDRFCELRSEASVKASKQSKKERQRLKQTQLLTFEPDFRKEFISLLAEMLKESVRDESVYLPQDVRWILATELELLLSGYRQALLHSSKARSSNILGHPLLESIKQEGVHWLSRKIRLGAPTATARLDFMKAFGIAKSTVSKWEKKFATEIADPEIYLWHRSLDGEEAPEQKDLLAEADKHIKRLGALYQQVEEELKPDDEEVSDPPI